MKKMVLSRRLLSILLFTVIVVTTALVGCSSSEAGTTPEFTSVTVEYVTPSPTPMVIPTSTTITPTPAATTSTKPPASTTTTRTSTTPSPSSTTPSPTIHQYSLESEGLTGDKILFSAYAQANSQGLKSYFIVNTDGAGLKKLPNMDNLDICVSPDGKNIAYFASNGFCFIYNISDDKATKLFTDTSSGTCQRYLAWSPEGSRLAYVRLDGELYMINTDGTGNKYLDQPNSAEYIHRGLVKDQIRNPAWTSDGLYLLYDDFSEPDHIYSNEEPTSIYNRFIISLNVGPPGNQDHISSKLVFDNAVVERSAQYISKIFISYNGSLCVINDDGTGLFQFERSVTYPQYSPDANCIAYLSDRTLMILDDAAQTLVKDNSLLISSNFIWFPDSQHIAYPRQISADTAEIHLIRRDFSHDLLVRLSPGQFYALTLVACVK